MVDSVETLWTIDELGAQVAAALSVDYDGAASGRVRDVPDRRTIRYYTTLGLIDRPAEMRGRTAYYGRRHLLQLVAIKRLQARGQTLAELQQQLLGRTDRQLETVARLPDAVGKSGAPVSVPETRRREAFWSAAPAEPIATDKTVSPDLPLQGVRLAEDLTLLLGAVRPLEPDDLEAIRVAAAPLVTLLTRRRLLRPRP